MTYENRNLRQYLDGQLVLNSPDTGIDPVLNDDPLLIGRNARGAFLGKIDDVRIYDRPLSVDEIGAIATDR